MANADLRSTFDVANMISGSQVRQVQERFERLPGKQAVLVPRLGYGKPVKFNDAMKYEWIIDEYRPTHVKINNGAGYNTSATDIVVDEADIVQVGHMLKNGDELMRITAIDSSTNTLTVERGFSSTSGAALVDDQELLILAPSYLDTATFPQSPTRRGDFVFNYPQQLMYKFGQTSMASANRSYLNKESTELATSKAKHMYEAVRELEASVWYGVKQQPTGANVGAFDGVNSFITTHVNSDTGLLTATKIIDLLDEVMQDSGGGMGRSFYMGRRTKRVFDAVFNSRVQREMRSTETEVGVVIDRVHWNGGTFDFVVCDLLEEGEAFLLNLSDISIRPADIEVGKGAGWVEGERSVEINDALMVEQFYAFIGTLVVENERRHGKLTGINTDLSNYPGAA